MIATTAVAEILNYRHTHTHTKPRDGLFCIIRVSFIKTRIKYARTGIFGAQWKIENKLKILSKIKNLNLKNNYKFVWKFQFYSNFISLLKFCTHLYVIATVSHCVCLNEKRKNASRGWKLCSGWECPRRRCRSSSFFFLIIEDRLRYRRGRWGRSHCCREHWNFVQTAYIIHSFICIFRFLTAITLGFSYFFLLSLDVFAWSFRARTRTPLRKL